MNFFSHYKRFCLAGTLAFALTLLFCQIGIIYSETSYTWIWGSDVHFGLSSYNTQIAFDDDIYLGGFTFMDGNSISYSNILLDDAVSSIVLGTETSNMTVTYLSPSQISYSVTGAGSQLVDVNKQPYAVVLDGSPTIEGIGYTYDSGTGEITVTEATETATMTFLSAGGNSSSSGFTDPLFVYLLEGDFLGFIFACYTQTIGSTIYAIGIFFISSVVYLRSKSLFIVSLIWIFVGSLFIGLFREFSFLAGMFTLLGIGGVLVEFVFVWRHKQ